MGQTRATLFLGWDPAKKIAGARAAVKEALLLGIQFWHKRFLPEHFRPGASGRYGYRQRSGDYLKRKAKDKPGAPDLVYSGRMRDACQKYMHYQASAGGAKVRMHVGHLRTKTGFNYATFRRKSGLNLAAEVTTLLADEVKSIANVVRLHIRKWLAAKAGGRGASARNAAAALGRSGYHGRSERAA